MRPALLLPLLVASALACFSDAPQAEESASASATTTATANGTATEGPTATETASDVTSNPETDTDTDLPDVDNCGVIADFGPVFGEVGNDDDVAEAVGVAPDPWGRIFIDLAPEVSEYAYLGIIELVVE